ncbi:DUSAM domain-containing protein [Pyxidicoccus trucidator]|uniref:DUSAM domain-containing protein n=1 Tax=Pyxidicoccus trucidator TaxID=2709662 RepID=UPI0013DC3B35|nr:DUSAM domain-containing protein [Pyxidicoccus trucidator]
MVEARDWDRLIEWGQRLQRGETLELTDDFRELLRRVAGDLAVSDAEALDALSAPATATALVRELNRRIRDGSRRLSRTLADANRRKEAGDIEGARAVLESVLSVEVVPLYREQVEVALAHLEGPQGDLS